MSPMLTRWKIIPTRSAHAPVFEWVHDSNVLVCGNHDGTIDLWDVGTEQVLKTWRGGIASIASLSVDPTRDVLATADMDLQFGMIRLWDLQKSLLKEWPSKHEDFISQITFSPSGTLLASVDGHVELWDARTAGQIRVLAGDLTVAFSPDGKLLATRIDGDRDLKDYGGIRLWEATTGNLYEQLLGNATYVAQLAFSSDGNYIASRGMEHVYATRPRDLITIWDLTAKTALTSWHTGYDLYDITFTLDKKTLVATGGYPFGIISFWEARTGQLLYAESIDGSISRMRLSPDGKFLAGGGSDGTIQIWMVNPSIHISQH